MLSKLKVGLAFLGGIIVLLFMAFFKGRSSGKESVREEIRQTEIKEVKAVAEKRVQDSKVVKDVQQNVIGSSDDSVDGELLDNWTRPDSGK